VLDQRLAALTDELTPRTIAIDAVFEKKIAAIKAYASQIGELFGGEEAMIRVMSEYMQGLRPEGGVYGERLWRVNR
jgi:hypothetical protein